MGKNRADETMAEDQEDDSILDLPEYIYDEERDGNYYEREELAKKERKKEKKEGAKRPKNVSFQLPPSDSEPESEAETPAMVVPSKSNDVIPSNSKNVASPVSQNGTFSNGHVEEYVREEPMEVEDDSSTVMFLIRKPIEVSVEDLQALQFTLKDKEVQLETEKGKFSATISSAPKMVHIACPRLLTAKDAHNIKSDGIVNKQITIRRRESSSEVEPKIKVKSIRKKVVLEMDHLQERLKAYGIIPKKKKHRRSLKNLRFKIDELE